MPCDPLAQFQTAQTPPTQPIPGREADMVRDNAGGYVFERGLWRQVEDFLLLGTAGGTFYLGEQTLTLKNVDTLMRAVREDASRVAALAWAVNTAKPARAPKPQPQLFALAAVMAEGDTAARTKAPAQATGWDGMIRTTDHLTTFLGYHKQLHGKTTPRGAGLRAGGRAMKRLLAGFFTNADVESVAFRAVKARQRSTPSGEAMSLRDVLRIAHPRAESIERAALFGWLAGNISDEVAARHLETVDKFLRAQAAPDAREAARLVTDLRVPWEFLPSNVLSDAAVWDALISTVGLTALLRNLARMSRIGTFDVFASDAVRRASARLTDKDAVVRARVHPMDVWLALMTYASGRSVQTNRNGFPVKSSTWTPNAHIVDALGEMWENSFGAVEPSGARWVVAVDSSGSMSARQVTANGSNVGSAYQVACTMAAILAKSEPNVHVIEFDTSVRTSRITPRTTLDSIIGMRPRNAGTNLARPFEWAQAEGVKTDGFVLLSDYETWAGEQHPSQALTAYRSAVSADARVVMATLTPDGFTVGDPRDEGVMNVAGVDASLPRVVSGWLR